MKKITQKDHTKALVEAMVEQMEDNEVNRNVLSSVMQDAVIFGSGMVKITRDGKLKRLRPRR